MVGAADRDSLRPKRQSRRQLRPTIGWLGGKVGIFAVGDFPSRFEKAGQLPRDRTDVVGLQVMKRTIGTTIRVDA